VKRYNTIIFVPHAKARFRKVTISNRSLLLFGAISLSVLIAAVAFGEPAVALARVANGTALRCSGFLARRYRTGISVLLHVNEFETLDNALEGN